MTIGGVVLMTVSWTVILFLVFFTFRKVLKND